MMRTFNLKKGYSVVELMVAIGVLTLIISVFGAFQADVFSLNKFIQVGIGNQYEAKKIIRPFANEIRGAVPSSQGAYALAETASTTLTFYSNIDSDTRIERIRYFMEGDTFKKGVLKPSGSPLSYDEDDEEVIQVVHNVIPGQIFYYYDSDYNGTASTTALSFPITPSDVRLVKIILQIDNDPNVDPGPVFVETQISIRNLKDNL